MFLICEENNIIGPANAQNGRYGRTRNTALDGWRHARYEMMCRGRGSRTWNVDYLNADDGTTDFSSNPIVIAGNVDSNYLDDLKPKNCQNGNIASCITATEYNKNFKSRQTFDSDTYTALTSQNILGQCDTINSDEDYYFLDHTDGENMYASRLALPMHERYQRFCLVDDIPRNLFTIHPPVPSLLDKNDKNKRLIRFTNGASLYDAHGNLKGDIVTECPIKDKTFQIDYNDEQGIQEPDIKIPLEWKEYTVTSMSDDGVITLGEAVTDLAPLDLVEFIDCDFLPPVDPNIAEYELNGKLVQISTTQLFQEVDFHQISTLIKLLLKHVIMYSQVDTFDQRVGEDLCVSMLAVVIHVVAH